MTHTHYELFRQEYIDRFSVDSANASYADWLCRNTTLAGRPFSYKGYEFQTQIVNDMSQDLDVIKISQIGMTEVQLRKALAFLKRNRGTKAIFSLPDEAMFEKVSVSRLAPIIQDNKVFNTRYDLENKVTRTKEIKQFGQSFLFIGAAIEKLATSVDADLVMNDEVDLSDQKILGLFTSRLQGSKHKIHQRFSTPTFPGFGIDANFNITDQHLYFAKCTACRKWCHPEFTPDYLHIPGLDQVMKLDGFKQMSDITQEMVDMMDLKQSYVCCNNCRAPLDLGNPGMREWVPTYAHRSNRGYRITPFATTMLDIPYILKRLIYFKQMEFVRGWYNTVIGQPYSDDTIQMSKEMLEQCFTGNTNPPAANYQDVWVGIDVGQICHIVLARGPNADHIIETRTVNVRDLVTEVQEICKTHRVRGGCIDRHPYEPTANDVFLASGGRIIPVEYRGKKTINIVLDEMTGEATHAQVNRTWFLDQFVRRITKEGLTVSGYGHQKQILIDHFRAMARNEEPEKEAEWQKLNNNDHYFHAAAFCVNAPAVTVLRNFKVEEVEHTVVAGVVTNYGKANPADVRKKPVVRPLGRR